MATAHEPPCSKLSTLTERVGHQGKEIEDQKKTLYETDGGIKQRVKLVEDILLRMERNKWVRIPVLIGALASIVGISYALLRIISILEPMGITK